MAAGICPRVCIVITLLLGTTLAAQDQTANEDVTIPFHLTKWNNISVPSTLDHQIDLNLMFHTAVDSVSLVESFAEKHKQLKFDTGANIQSWGGSQASSLSRGHRLAFGPRVARDETVFLDKHSGHETDGKFGPLQLGSQCFRVDFDKGQLQVFSSLPKDLDWESLPLTQRDGMWYLEGELGVGSERIAQTFLVHSGYSGFLLLDDDFSKKHEALESLPVIERSELKDSLGNTLATVKATLPDFRVGTFEFKKVPISYFSGAIGRQKMSVLGGDFLKRFNLVFDLENERLYLQPSKLHRNAFF